MGVPVPCTYLGADQWALTDPRHRGANHPVRDLQTGKIEITSQNHGFAVDPDSLGFHPLALASSSPQRST